MNRFTNKLGMLACLVGVALIGAGGGCDEKSPSADGTSTGEPEATPTVSADDSDSDVDTKVLGILVKADALDGTTDKIVSKCAGCGLSMDGDPAHALTVGEYTLHLCSAECKTDFEKDATKAVLALKVD